MAAVDRSEIVSISGHDFQQVIRGSGHEMTFQYIWYSRDSLFKRIQNFVGLGGQGNFDKNRGLAANLAGIQQGNVVANDPFFLKALHATVAGRRGEIHLFGHLGMGHAAAPLQCLEDSPIYLINFHFSHDPPTF